MATALEDSSIQFLILEIIYIGPREIVRTFLNIVQDGRRRHLFYYAL